jgi:hypothetical protein
MAMKALDSNSAQGAVYAVKYRVFYSSRADD